MFGFAKQGAILAISQCRSATYQERLNISYLWAHSAQRAKLIKRSCTNAKRRKRSNKGEAQVREEHQYRSGEAA